MIKALFNYMQDSACPFHRILLPSRFCCGRYENNGVCKKVSIDVNDGLPDGYDIYFFHGLGSGAAVLELTKMKRKGKKVVWCLDDDWYTIPDWNPAKQGEDGLALHQMMKDLCDWIIVSTQALALTFKDISHKVLVAPNLLDLSQFPKYPYQMTDDNIRHYPFEVKLPIRIVWSGGITHKGDLEVGMVDAIDKIMTKHNKDRVVTVFQGAWPHSDLIKKYLHKGLFHQPFVPFPSYQKVLNSIEPNIYLAPMAMIPFNLSKSNLRIMEGWALMSCPVVTPWGEYATIKSGEDGLFATTADDWFEALDRLVTDHSYRLTMAANGRQRVENEFDWNNEKCRKPWYNALDTIFNNM